MAATSHYEAFPIEIPPTNIPPVENPPGQQLSTEGTEGEEVKLPTKVELPPLVAQTENPGSQNKIISFVKGIILVLLIIIIAVIGITIFIRGFTQANFWAAAFGGIIAIASLPVGLVMWDRFN